MKIGSDNWEEQFTGYIDLAKLYCTANLDSLLRLSVPSFARLNSVMISFPAGEFTLHASVLVPHHDLQMVKKETEKKKKENRRCQNILPPPIGM